MLTIVPYISKSKLGKQFHYAVKYSDVEACFSGRTEEGVYLHMYFWAGQTHSKKVRDRLHEEGNYRLVEMNYDPEPPRYRHSWEPWRDVENPKVVSVSIYGLPNELARQTGLKRDLLRAALVRQTGVLAAEGWLDRRWYVDLRLKAKVPALECASRVWTGLRPEPEKLWLIPLDEETETAP